MSILEQCEILSVAPLREGAVDMTVACRMGGEALAGQFVHIKCGDGLLLRRPISLCDAGDGWIRLVIESVGAGTAWLTRRKSGDVLDVLGPLGKRGFPAPDADKPALLIGGGVGAAPLLMLARRTDVPCDAIFGFKRADLVILEHDFMSCCRSVTVCTDDGSYGQKGFVTDAARRLMDGSSYGAIYACGNMSMLKAVAELGLSRGVTTWVSLDERMGCGLGSCLVCACRTPDDRYLHICKQGPVFEAGEVAW